MKGDQLGELEELTLLGVCALKGEVYGVPVLQFVEAHTGRNVTIGAIYAAHAQEAVGANVIGSPCYVLDGEVFWGQDRLGLLESALKSGRKAYRMDATGAS